MTKQEFIKQKKLFDKKFEQNDIFYAVAFVALLLLNWLLVSYFDALLESWFVTYLILLFCSLFMSIRWIKKLQQREISNSDLRCFSCNGLLIGDLADLALATDHCPKCGQHAFENP